ncbi:hypothetical protein NLI96_g8124 [Meripilus lineatus]|uniref:Cytochrome P450 n=1 Tax=Meripilus lineatus TaxID=2056292 RepID=A0AAD5V331_9APHY|nr:hypothetical protein NLI96_g8124 [Physisporinus lineatus]
MSSGSDSPPVLYVLLALATAVYVVSWARPSKHSVGPITTSDSAEGSPLTSDVQLPDIPAIGPSAPLLSYYGVFKCLSNCREMLQEGYDRYKGSVFKIPLPFHWHVIVSGPKLIEELRKAEEDELSFGEAVAATLQIDHTLGPEIHHNSYHIPIIRSQLTRNIGAVFSAVKDELSLAFNEIIPPSQEWTKVTALPTIMKVVSRTSNRVFVGLPTCQDPDYCALNVQFAIDVVKGAIALNMFPKILRPLVKNFVTNVPATVARCVKHLEPVIKERYRQLEEHGESWEDKPNDMLMWLMEEATGREKDVKALVMRILTVNFAAIHTSSMSFAHALYRLAANPEYLAPMRDEVESIVKSEGWTKAAMQKMRKVDSFLRECQRYYGLGPTSMTRLALQDFQFSDGTRIPQGTFVSIAAEATHRDDNVYDEANQFNPWRFANLREEEGEGLKHQMVSTSPQYTPFGHGKHACPGRFFAANELKAMMAHLVLTYDVKMEEEGVIPQSLRFFFNTTPNPKAEVLFRRRQMP